MLKFLKAQDVRSVRIDEVEHEHEYSLRLIRSLVFPEADLLSMNRLTETLLSNDVKRQKVYICDFYGYSDNINSPRFGHFELQDVMPCLHVNL